MAVMAAMLASGGVNPMSGERALLARHGGSHAPARLATLAEHRLCAGAGDEELQVLDAALQRRSLSAGPVLMRRGEPSEALALAPAALAQIRRDCPPLAICLLHNLLATSAEAMERLTIELAALEARAAKPYARPPRPRRRRGVGMDLGIFSLSLAVKDIAASKACCEKLGFTTLGGGQRAGQLHGHRPGRPSDPRGPAPIGARRTVGCACRCGRSGANGPWRPFAPLRSG